MISGRAARPDARDESFRSPRLTPLGRVTQGKRVPFMLLEPAPQSARATMSSAAHVTEPRAPKHTSTAHPEPSIIAPRRLSAWDYTGMLAGFLLTLAITLQNSRGRIFWEDEMLGWLLLRDPSWHHMIRAWKLGADGGGFSFYLLGRAWFRLFGDSALAFRMFTSTCFGLAFVATWAALRRFYPVWIVAFATANTLFFSPPLTMHFIEGRFYGLLVMSTAAALWLALVLDEAPEPTPKRLYVASFLVHGLLTTSHLLGVVFSAFLLGATVALDTLRGRRRIGLYLATAATWLLLIPERTSIVAAGRVGRPHFWTRPPTFFDLVGAWSGYSTEIRLVLATLLVLAAFVLWRQPGDWRQAWLRQYRQRRAIYVVACGLLLVPVWFLLEGLVGTWLFNERYLQPVTLGLAYVTAELAMIAAGWPLLASLRRRFPLLSVAAVASSAVLFVALTFVWVFHHVAQNTPEAVDFTDQLTARLPHDIPVVVEDAFTFTGLISRQADSGVQYTFLLDWPFSIRPEAPRLEVTQYHLMQNWKLAGYYPDHIQDAASFLRDHDRFLVLHSGVISQAPGAPKPDIGNPVAERLAGTTGFEVRRYFTLDRLDRDDTRETVWLVCRGSCKGRSLPPEPDRCVLTARGTDCCSGPACKLPEAEVPPRFWQVQSWWK